MDTLFSAFKGGEGARMPLTSGFPTGFPADWAVGLATTPAETFEYSHAVRESFLANPIAQRAVRIVAEGIAQAPLTTTDPKLMALVTATSAGQPLIETLAAYLLLHGNDPASGWNAEWIKSSQAARLLIAIQESPCMERGHDLLSALQKRATVE
ncbi:MAG: hypothetical protein AAF907_00980 [Planctomycetota bacterium]